MPSRYSWATCSWPSPSQFLPVAQGSLCLPLWRIPVGHASGSLAISSTSVARSASSRWSFITVVLDRSGGTRQIFVEYTSLSSTLTFNAAGGVCVLCDWQASRAVVWNLSQDGTLAHSFWERVSSEALQVVGQGSYKCRGNVFVRGACQNCLVKLRHILSSTKWKASVQQSKWKMAGQPCGCWRCTESSALLARDGSGGECSGVSWMYRFGS